MTNKPSDRAIAQAFCEWVSHITQAWRDGHPAELWVPNRARDIDAAAPDGAQAVASLWVQYSDDGRNIRFWTSDPNRALEESFCHARPLTAYYTSPPSQDAEDAARLAVAVHNATKAYERTRCFYTSESLAAFDAQVAMLKAFYGPVIEASNQRKIDAARAAQGGG